MLCTEKRKIFSLFYHTESIYTCRLVTISDLKKDKKISLISPNSFIYSNILQNVKIINQLYIINPALFVLLMLLLILTDCTRSSFESPFQLKHSCSYTQTCYCPFAYKTHQKKWSEVSLQEKTVFWYVQDFYLFYNFLL